MQNSNLDKRVIRTKTLLEESLFNLLKTKDINKISVTELSNSININRSTFYDHYDDVYDLLESVQTRLLEDISNLYKNVTIHTFKDRDMNELFKILDYMKNNKDLFKVLLNGYGSLLFVEKLKRAITEKFTDDFIGRMPTIDKKYYTALSSFFISGCIGLIQEWLKNDAIIPTVELTKIMKTLIINCIGATKTPPNA